MKKMHNDTAHKFLSKLLSKLVLTARLTVTTRVLATCLSFLFFLVSCSSKSVEEMSLYEMYRECTATILDGGRCEMLGDALHPYVEKAVREILKQRNYEQYAWYIKECDKNEYGSCIYRKHNKSPDEELNYIEGKLVLVNDAKEYRFIEPTSILIEKDSKAKAGKFKLFLKNRKIVISNLKKEFTKLRVPNGKDEEALTSYAVAYILYYTEDFKSTHSCRIVKGEFNRAADASELEKSFKNIREQLVACLTNDKVLREILMSEEKINGYEVKENAFIIENDVLLVEDLESP